MGNLACRIVMRLANAPCIWSLQNSMGLDREQAETIASLEQRRAVVHYTLHPTPFAIEIPLMDFPAKPQDSQLRQQAEGLLSQIKWTEQHGRSPQKTFASSARILAPDDLAGDALLVMVRICQEPAEPIEQRCEVLRMERAREFRARAELDAKGLIVQAEQTVGGKIKLFQTSEKGEAWAQKRNIHIKKFKSGIVHEYLLCQVEKRIGLLGPKWRLQRNSSVARDQGLQPDLLVMGPGGKRIIVEVRCNNFDYDARNILIEANSFEIDHLVAVTPDKQTKRKLDQALKGSSQNTDKDWQRRITTLDAGECPAAGFDWASVGCCLPE